MSILKPHDVEGFLAGLDANSGRIPFCVMAFGPDRGMVSDAIERFCDATSIDTSDTLAVAVLDGASVASDPGRLWDELNAPGLFGGGRLVRIRDAGGDKRLADAIRSILSDPPGDVFLGIEAGDLKRTSGIVKAFENARHAVALPCYPADARGKDRMVERLMSENGMAIDEDARAELVATLADDHRAARGAIEKLLLYGRGQDRIGVDDVRAALQDGANGSAGNAVDAALRGDGSGFEREYRRLLAARVSPFLVLRDLSAQLGWIEKAQGEAGGHGPKAAKRITALTGRRMHFRRVPALEEGARRLPTQAVRALATQTARAVLATRLDPNLEAELVAALAHAVLYPDET